MIPKCPHAQVDFVLIIILLPLILPSLATLAQAILSMPQHVVPPACSWRLELVAALSWFVGGLRD